MEIEGKLMARVPEEREELLREARALVVRAEMEVDGFDEPVVVGFRRTGAASFYFGQDVVYQFNTASELRRAYLDGEMYKSEKCRLVRLHPRRTDESLELVSHELTPAETTEFLSAAAARIRALQSALCQNRYRLIAQVPQDQDVPKQIRQRLASLPAQIALAETPRIGNA
jgi:hypothetical protein